MAYIDELLAQANAAVQAGADPAAVEARLQQLMQQAGMQPEAVRPPKIDKTTKQAYKNAVIPETIQELNQAPNSPSVFSNVEGGVGPVPQEPTAGDRFTYGVEGPIKKAIGTGLGLLAGYNQATNPLINQDEQFAAAQALRNAGQSDINKASGTAGTAGQLASGLLTWPLQPASEGMDVLDKGGSLGQAEAENLKGSAVNAASLGAGFLGPQAAGVANYLARAALQSGANLGITAADRAYEGQPLSPADIATAVGAGAFGGLFRNEPHVKAPKELKTGDDIVDKGISAYVNYGRKDKEFPEQGDLFTKNNENQLIGDLFGAEPVTGSTAEARRLRALEEGTTRTPEEQAALEQDYIFNQQDRLRKAAQSTSKVEPVPPNLESVDPRAQADLWNVGVPEGPRTSSTQNFPPNDAMREAFRLAGLRRAVGLMDQPGGEFPNYYPDVAHNPPAEGLSTTTQREAPVFEPSRNPTIEQTAEQLELPLETQGDLFNQSSPRQEPLTFRKPVESPTKTQEESVPSTRDLQATLSGLKDLSVLLSPEGQKIQKTIAPTVLVEKLKKGDLTVNDVLDHYSNLSEESHPTLKEFGNAIKYLKTLSENLGGGQTKFNILDTNNPAHAQILTKNASIIGDKTPAFYDPASNAIYMRPGVEGGNTMVHEVAHAITSKMLYMGERGLLNPAAQGAYSNLSKLFENVLKPELSRRASGMSPIDKVRRTYGLTNLHEFYSEFFSNAIFRNSLKDLKLSGDWVSSLPPAARGLVMRAKTVYDLAMKGISRTMARAGLKSFQDVGVTADKIANAYDAMFTHMDSLHNKLSADEMRISREVNARNTERPANPQTPSVYTTGSDLITTNNDRAGRTLVADDYKQRFMDFVDNLRRRAMLEQHGEHVLDTMEENDISPIDVARKFWNFTYDKLPPEVQDRFNAQLKGHAGLVPREGGTWKELAREIIDLPKSAGDLEGTDRGFVVLMDEANKRVEEAMKRPVITQERLALPAPEEVMEEPQLRAPQSRLGQIVREWGTSKGSVPEATEARQQVQGQLNAARAVSTAFRNLAEANRDKIDIGDVEAVLSNYPNAKRAFDNIKSVAPQLAEALNQQRQRRFDMSIKIATEALRSPNLSEKDRAVVNKILKNANSYLTTVRAVDELPNFSKDLFDKAAKGDQEATKTISDAKAYLAQRWLPGLDSLGDMKGERLDELYKMHTGLNPDSMFEHIPTEQKQQLMRAAISDRLNAIANKDQFLDNVVKQVAGLNDSDVSAIARYYKNIKEGSNVLSAKTHVPPAISRLWGEVSDPLIRMYHTIEQQASQYAQIKSQNDLRESGLANGLFTERPDTTTHTSQLTGEAFGALQGLYTTPDVARAIESSRVLNMGVMDMLSLATVDRTGKLANNALLAKGSDVLSKASGINKAANIVGNLGNIPMNLLGSPLQLASNGNFNPVAWAKGMKTMADLIGAGIRKNLSPEAERALRLNLAEVSQTQELQAHPKSAALQSLLDGASRSSNPIKYIASAGKEGLRLFHEVYGAMDLWTKFANFENELSFWQKQNTGMSPEQLERFVANRINNSNITPSNTPMVLKSLERHGLTMYGTYYAQVMKNTGYNIAYGARDLVDGIKNGNAALALHGASRLGGVATYLGAASKLYGSIGAGALGLMGLVAQKLPDSDPRSKYMNKDEFLRGISTLNVSDPNNKNAGEFVLDIDRPNPFGPIAQPFNRIAEAIGYMNAGDRDKALESAKIAAQDLTGLATNNTLFSYLGKIASGAKPSIANTAPASYNEFSQALTDAGLSQDMANRVISAAQIVTPKTYKNYLAAKEIEGDTPLKAAVTSGMGVYKFNVGKDIQDYLGKSLNQDISAARKPYTDLLKASYLGKPERIDSEFRSGMKQLVRPYEKMVAAVDAAKAQGLDRNDIIKKLVNSGLNQDVAGMIMANKPVPVIMMLGDPEEALLKQIEKEDNPVKRERLMANAQAKMKIFSQLFSKYRDVSMDDLRNQLGTADTIKEIVNGR